MVDFWMVTCPFGHKKIGPLPLLKWDLRQGAYDMECGDPGIRGSAGLHGHNLLVFVVLGYGVVYNKIANRREADGYGLAVFRGSRRNKMFEIRYAANADKAFWFTLDNHISEDEFLLKVQDKRAYVISANDKPVGVMRYNLFWDNIPFLTLINFDEAYQGKGFGRQAMLFWENEMREYGYKMVITSTQVDEQAQHFYRKLGYIEKGCLSFDNTPLEQPMEMFLMKNL